MSGILVLFAPNGDEAMRFLLAKVELRPPTDVERFG
jgi:hypothetical protein